MSHWIGILSTDTTARDPDGEYLPPTVFAYTWASISLLTGRELDKAESIVAEVTHLIKIPYQPGIRSQMIVAYDFSLSPYWPGRQFQIMAVADADERKVDLNLYAVEMDEGVDQTL
jgi:SPP1 family predicted phage head-tail adaptor